MKKFAEKIDAAVSASFRWWVKATLSLMLRPKTYNKSLPEVPCIIVSNHISPFDGAVVGTVFRKRRIFFFIAKDMFKSRLRSVVLKACGSIPLERYGPDITWIKEGLRVLRHDSVYMCPEGRCAPDGNMREFKPGFITLAALSGAPIVPVYQNGCYNYFFGIGRRMRLIVGDPVYIEKPDGGMTEAFVTAKAKEIENTVIQLKEQLSINQQKRGK